MLRLIDYDFSHNETIVLDDKGRFIPSLSGYLMIGPYTTDFETAFTSTKIIPLYQDVYQDYMYIKDGDQFKWIMIGDTSVDISNFATLQEIGEINEALNEIAKTLRIWNV